MTSSFFSFTPWGSEIARGINSFYNFVKTQRADAVWGGLAQRQQLFLCRRRKSCCPSCEGCYSVEGTVTDCLPTLMDMCFSLLSDSCESHSLLIQLLSTLWSFWWGVVKKTPCDTSHIVLVCALGYGRCCALTMLAELMGSWLYRIPSLYHGYPTLLLEIICIRYKHVGRLQ